jgi:hypothetical protein
MSDSQPPPGPWPWILGGLLAFMVAGSLAFLAIAIKNPDPLVVEDAKEAYRGPADQTETLRKDAP